MFLIFVFWSGAGYSYTLLDGNFELKGFVRNITAVRTENPKGGLGGDQFKSGDVELSKSFLQLEGSHLEFEREGTAVGAGITTRRSISKAKTSFRRRWSTIRGWETRFENCTWISSRDLLLRLGKQQVVWGNPTVSSRRTSSTADFRHYFLEDWQDIRQGLPMARVIYGVTNKTDLEFVWVPVTFKPAKYAGVGTYWEFPGAGIGGIAEKNYDTNINNGSVGGKIKTTLGSGFVVSLYDYYNRFETPTAELTSTGL
jgi:hypothetical protein